MSNKSILLFLILLSLIFCGTFVLTFKVYKAYREKQHRADSVEWSINLPALSFENYKKVFRQNEIVLVCCWSAWDKQTRDFLIQFEAFSQSHRATKRVEFYSLEINGEEQLLKKLKMQKKLRKPIAGIPLILCFDQGIETARFQTIPTTYEFNLLLK